jgi:hypothetical protein
MIMSNPDMTCRTGSEYRLFQVAGYDNEILNPVNAVDR